MAKAMLISVSVFLSISVLPQLYGFKVDFFNVLEELVLESRSTTNCTEIKARVTINEIFSSAGRLQPVLKFKTDRCLVTFFDKNCNSPVSYKYLASEHMQQSPHNLRSASFHFCNDKDGGTKLNVDLTHFYDPDNSLDIPITIRSYQNMCMCVNIPYNVQQMAKWSINNHGNDLFAYYEPNCLKQKWKPTFIPAGHSEKSWKMHLHEKIDSVTNTRYKIHSLGPDPESSYFKTYCDRNKLIMNLELFESMKNSSQQYISYDEINKENNKIEFFSRTDFQDSLLEGNLTAHCTNLKRREAEVATYDVKSIQTTGCVLIYSEFDCQGRSIKVERGGISNLVKIWESTITGQRTLHRLYTKYPNWNWMTKSYHICNENVGNDKHLNVDLIPFSSNSNAYLEHQTGFQRFRNICSCNNINVPSRYEDQYSINNFGNSLVAYFGEDCSSSSHSPLWIPSGMTSFSVGFGAFRRKVDEKRILSFGPDVNAKYFKNSCATDAIMNLELFEISNSTRLPSSTEDVASASMNTKNEEDDIQIYFYSHPNFIGFLHESDSRLACNNLPKQHGEEWITNKIGSIRTNVCIMIYSEHDCKGRSIKLFVKQGSRNLFDDWKSTVSGPNTLAALAESYPDFQWTTKSFHICNNEIGGPQLNLEITDYQVHFLADRKPNVLQSYQNLCSCHNIPKYIQNKGRWSLNNYGNSLMAYFEPNCMSIDFLPLWIPPGQSSYSVGISSFRQTSSVSGVVQHVKSIGPQINSTYFKTNCVKISTTIVKFVIVEPENEEANTQNYSEQNVEMTSSKTEFRNNGPSQFTQTYTASSTVRSAYSVNTGTSFNKMHRVQMDSSFDVETKKVKIESDSLSLGNAEQVGVSATASAKFLGIGLEVTTSFSKSNSNTRSNSSSVSQEAGLREGFRKAYESSGTTATSQTEETVVEETKTLSHSQTIHVEACTEQTVHAYVKMVTMKREYIAVAKVSGKIGERELSAKEVRENMDSKAFTYISDFDDSTVWAYTHGNFRAEYGISAFINSDGQTLSDCVKRTNLCVSRGAPSDTSATAL